jgi:hypothetical protein
MWTPTHFINEKKLMEIKRDYVFPRAAGDRFLLISIWASSNQSITNVKIEPEQNSYQEQGCRTGGQQIGTADALGRLVLMSLFSRFGGLLVTQDPDNQ